MMAVYAAVLGLFFGSFISNSLWQVREVETKGSLPQSKRSVCGHCGHKLAVKDLVPLISWLSLGGKCRYCDHKLSIQYPLVELLTASLFAWSALSWNLQTSIDWLQLGLWLLVLTGLITMAIYDLRWFELPNKVMALTLVLAIVFVAVGIGQQDSSSYLLDKLQAALLGGGGFYLLHIAGKGKWMGGGDVKLAFVMGVILGSQLLLVALFLGFLSAATVSLFLLAKRKLGRKDLIPFGPFLIAATWIAMLYGRSLIDLYLGLLTY